MISAIKSYTTLPIWIDSKSIGWDSSCSFTPSKAPGLPWVISAPCLGSHGYGFTDKDLLIDCIKVYV